MGLEKSLNSNCSAPPGSLTTTAFICPTPYY
jgi:hypothetical protein